MSSNLHKVHRLASIQPSIVGTQNTISGGFITPLMDAEVNFDAEVSKISPLGVDSITDTMSHSQEYNIKLMAVLNGQTMQLIDELLGNPEPSPAYDDVGVISEASTRLKIEKFNNNEDFEYLKKVDITIVDTVKPIDFSSPINVFSAINSGIGRVEVFKDCSIKHIGNVPSDYTRVTIEVVTGKSRAVSKIQNATNSN